METYNGNINLDDQSMSGLMMFLIQFLSELKKFITKYSLFMDLYSG